MRQRKHPYVVNLSEVELAKQVGPGSYVADFGSISSLVGASKLGYRLTVLEPGKRAWPKHAHLSNEEMFLILEGRGTFILGNERIAVESGDVICAPAGGENQAHQMVNDSTGPLRYLCVSTMIEPDVALYPDSKKFGIVAGAAPGGDKAKRTFAHVGKLDHSVDYWEGETD